MKVAIVGATGETGRSVVDGLLHAETTYEITALVRPASLQKPATEKLKARGVEIVPADLQSISHEQLVGILKGIDVVVSTIFYQALDDEKTLAEAAKAAGVQRYVPCFWATIAPRGVMNLRDKKEEILDHILRLRLPYTVIDIGWWFQLTLPRVPSGKLDYALIAPANSMFGNGDVPSALTDLRDVGTYVAKILDDPRTLNKKVFAFTELMTQRQIYDLVEKVTGEKPEITTVSAEEIQARCREGQAGIDQAQAMYQYQNSWGLRGDNTPENAKYLGYLLGDELYPGLKGRSLGVYIQEILDGKGVKVFSG
ncbi:NAD(P)-binding protein [Aspergillus unguis]